MGGKAGRSRGRGSDDAGAKAGLIWKWGGCCAAVDAALDADVGEVDRNSGRRGVLAGAALAES